MTLFPLSECCLHLGVDPKTWRCWLKAAQLAASLHPTDARVTCLTDVQLAQLARRHERHLPDPADLAPIATAHPPASPPAAASELASWRVQVGELQSQLLTLQTQLTDLTLTLLLRPLKPLTPAPKPSHPAPVAAPEPPLPPLTRGTVPAIRPRSQALIQVREDDSSVFITPDQGVLPIVPDSPEWFDWIPSLRSFRFQGKNGSYGATRKLKKGHAVAAFHIHFSRHGRSCNLSLSFFPAITVARLEDMAAAAIARTSHP